MATFKNLSQIQAHLQNNIHQIAKSSMQLERALAEIMHKVVVERVYESYTSSLEEMEKRRGDNDGLSDTRNMIVSSVDILSGGKVKITFENIAEGRDTMESDMLVDAFEQPNLAGYWDKQGAWSQGRGFIDETAEVIRQNPSEVISAIKSGLKSAGFIVR